MTIQANLSRSQLRWDTYMFLGNKYLSYSLTDNVIRVGPRGIDTGRPGLHDTQFADAIDAAVPFSYRPDPTRLVPPPEQEYVYIFRGDQYVRYDFKNEQIIYGPLDIGQWWPGTKDAGFDRDIDAAFLDPYGSISLNLKDGRHFRIWTQQNQGSSTPARSSAAASMNLPFTAADISSLGFRVDEYDLLSGDDFLARGTKEFTGNGTYTASADDGSVTVT
ncbi:hypothetical protein ACFV4N_35675 [Actinosynnema sp. NPDC059797]